MLNFEGVKGDIENTTQKKGRLVELQIFMWSTLTRKNSLPNCGVVKY